MTRTSIPSNDPADHRASLRTTQCQEWHYYNIISRVIAGKQRHAGGGKMPRFSASAKSRWTAAIPSSPRSRERSFTYRSMWLLHHGLVHFLTVLFHVGKNLGRMRRARIAGFPVSPPPPSSAFPFPATASRGYLPAGWGRPEYRSHHAPRSSSILELIERIGEPAFMDDQTGGHRTVRHGLHDAVEGHDHDVRQRRIDTDGGAARRS